MPPSALSKPNPYRSDSGALGAGIEIALLKADRWDAEAPFLNYKPRYPQIAHEAKTPPDLRGSRANGLTLVSDESDRIESCERFVESRGRDPRNIEHR